MSKVNPLPKCARCGRTLPRPLKPLWPAVVFCPCGAPGRKFPEPISEEQVAIRRQTMQKVNARRLGKGKVRGQPAKPPERLTEGRLDASSHVPDGGLSVPPAHGKKRPAKTGDDCTGEP